MSAIVRLAARAKRRWGELSQLIEKIQIENSDAKESPFEHYKCLTAKHKTHTFKLISKNKNNVMYPIFDEPMGLVSEEYHPTPSKHHSASGAQPKKPQPGRLRFLYVVQKQRLK